MKIYDFKGIRRAPAFSARNCPCLLMQSVQHEATLRAITPPRMITNAIMSTITATTVSAVTITHSYNGHKKKNNSRLHQQRQRQQEGREAAIRANSTYTRTQTHMNVEFESAHTEQVFHNDIVSSLRKRSLGECMPRGSPQFGPQPAVAPLSRLPATRSWPRE